MAEAMTVEQEAGVLGWAPKEEWRGPPERWVDAETFVERGHTVMPILRKNNQELLGKLNGAQSELAEVKKALAEQSDGLKKVLEFQAAEVKRQVESQVSSIRAGLKQARKDGDEDAVDTLETALDTAKDRLKAIETAPAPVAKAAPAAQEIEPWAKEWAEQNSEWYWKDKRKTAYVLAAADDLAKTTSLRGVDLLNKAKQEMEATFGGTPAADKAEGGSKGGGAAPSTQAKGFSSLPADAKAVANDQEKLMVGKGKPFKTAAEWHDHYVKVYNSSTESFVQR